MKFEGPVLEKFGAMNGKPEIASVSTKIDQGERPLLAITIPPPSLRQLARVHAVPKQTLVGRALSVALKK